MAQQNVNIPLKFTRASELLLEHPAELVIDFDFVTSYEHRVRLAAHIRSMFTIEKEKLRERWLTKCVYLRLSFSWLT